MRYSDLDKAALQAELIRVQQDYEALRGYKLNLNLTRGKPETAQLALSNDMFRTLDDGDFDANTLTANSGKLTFSYGDCDLQKASLGNISLTSKDGDLTVNELTLSGKTKIALSYGDAEITLNDSTKKVSGFDLATHYGTITASGLNGNKTLDEDDDVNTFQSDSKDGKTKLSIDSKDGDITVK